MKPLHREIEFQVDAVDSRATDKTWYFKAWPEACAMAVRLAATDGRSYHVDVLCYGEDGAKAWAGEEGIERYRDDPEASVFDRIVVKAESFGRIA